MHIRDMMKRDLLVIRLIISLSLFATSFLSTSIFAQAWKPGSQLLMKSNFKAAEAQLTSVLKSAKTREELAETYKYLGVAQYMLGKKQPATVSFQKAKSTNPAIRLADTEVVDESVIPFFNAVPAGNAASGGLPSNNLKASSSGVAKQKSKRTLLKVISNAPNARVSLDGIAYGKSGDEIEVQPGNVTLEVAASGFKPKAIRVKLDPLTTSSVTVNLEKIVPKPKPQPTPKALPLPDPSGQALAAGAGKKTPGKNPSSGKNDLFGDEPQADA